MSKTYHYEAFGFVIQSDYPIAQLPDASPDVTPDVEICQADLSDYNIRDEHYRISARELLIGIPNIAKFRITDGTRIEVHPATNCSESHLGVYLMGSCMGAVLHQRGFLPLHGSCVTDGNRAVLITGDSGAGKSTLAAEFLAHGWKLLTDDVAAVSDIERTPTVWASYPSQKLWQDSLEHYERSDSDIHSLYFSEQREKYGVNVSRFFCSGSSPLSLIIRLIPTDTPCHMEPIEGMTRVDQLMRNTYRIFMVPPEHRQRHFRRCVAMSGKVPMALVTRQIGVQCAGTLYKLIIQFLGELNRE